jgi:diacylglycerol kinase (CTP)
MGLKKVEVGRKMLHFIFGTVIPLGIFYLPLYAENKSWKVVAYWLYPSTILAVFFVLFVAAEFLRRTVPAVADLFGKWFSGVLRNDEAQRITGATYICASSLICSIVFRNHPHISFMVIAAFIWGDAVAALVGQSIGRVKIGGKTLEGSIACFVLCLCFFGLVFPHVPFLLDAWNGSMPPALAVMASLCITILELFPLRLMARFEVNDNLLVPVVTGALMIFLYPYC